MDSFNKTISRTSEETDSTLLEAALEATRACAWQRAHQLWLNSSCETAGSMEHLHAYALTCEALGAWEQHSHLLSAAFLRFPRDRHFRSRALYGQAVRDMDQQLWDHAFLKFDRLALNPAPPWPYAYNVSRWLCFLQIKLQAAVSFDSRMNILERWSTFKNAEIQSTQAAGLVIAIEVLNSRQLLAEELDIALRRFIAVLKSSDQPPVRIRSPEMQAATDALASAVTRSSHVLELLPPSLSFFLGRFFLGRGYPTIYIRAREIFITSLNSRKYEPQTSRLVDLMNLTALACEQGRKADYRSLCLLAKAQHVSGRRCFHLSALYHGLPSSATSLLADEGSLAFAECLRGRSVAIVGPIDVGLDHGAEIDSFDLVIRFNHRAGVTLETLRSGSRTDISYYIKDDLERYDKDIYLQIMNHLKWVVLDQWSPGLYPWLEDVTSPKRQRLEVWDYGHSPYLVGCPNAIQRVLMDLSRFEPSRVKVFNATLFLNMDFAGGYKDGNINIYADFARHDPASNFVFLQKVRDTGWVEFDPVLIKLLDMSVSEYLDELFLFHSRVNVS